MEWVETTGRTLEEAKDAALDQLGVDEHDAEFEVQAEPRIGLIGRVRIEARVRARVRPTAPRAKEDRRDRRRRQRGERPAAVGASPSEPPQGSKASTAAEPGGKGTRGTPEGTSGSGPTSSDAAPTPADAGAGGQTAGSNRKRRRGGKERSSNGGPDDPRSDTEVAATDRTRAGVDPREGEEVEIALEVQGQVAKEFLQGLVEEFGITANISVTSPDPDSVNLSLSGNDLGLLIGPKGATLLALQDITRTVVQRKTGATNGRIHVDVAGYRQKRSEALGRFARQVADQVRSTGTRRALEPMNPADRKVVHDALNEVPGVSTVSEGEEPERRVVIVPDEV